jgi:hypothetical protein
LAKTPTDDTKYAYEEYYTLNVPLFDGRSPAASAGFSAVAPLTEDAARTKHDQRWFKVGAEVNKVDNKVVPITRENEENDYLGMQAFSKNI